MKETRDFLTKIGMPSGDAYSLPTSEKRFEDGGQYRFAGTWNSVSGSNEGIVRRVG